MNKIDLTGRLTRVPELKQTENGSAYCNFTLAVRRPYSKGETDFFDCTAWRRDAEFLAKYIQRGQLVAVSGYLRTRKYEDKDGNNRTAFFIVVEDVEGCGSKKESENSAEAEAFDAAMAMYDPNRFEESVPDEELPF